MNWFIYLILLAFIGVSPAKSASFEEAVAAYAQGDYVQAFALFSQLATNDHLDAQNNLGVLFQTGQGVEQNLALAASWYRRAALQGHRDAQGNLAALFAVGQGVEKDLLLAYAWYGQAARQGDTTALQNREAIAKQLSANELTRAQEIDVFADAPPAPVVVETPPPAPVVAETPPAPVVVAPPITEKRATSAPVAVPVYFDAARLSADGKTYLVGEGDTLWSIARNTRPNQSMSIAAMVEAIRRANPQAFKRGSLQAGTQLRIPK